MATLKRNYPSVSEIDKNVKNKFKWEWLQNRVTFRYAHGKFSGHDQEVTLGNVILKMAKEELVQRKRRTLNI